MNTEFAHLYINPDDVPAIEAGIAASTFCLAPRTEYGIPQPFVNGWGMNTRVAHFEWQAMHEGHWVHIIDVALQARVPFILVIDADTDAPPLGTCYAHVPPADPAAPLPNINNMPHLYVDDSWPPRPFILVDLWDLKPTLEPSPSLPSQQPALTALIGALPCISAFTPATLEA